jgi:hypothetical protein
MMKLAALLIALGTACTTEEGPALRRVEPLSSAVRDQLTFVEPDQLREIPDDVHAAFCALLPSEGICASACDPAALAELIPQGECVIVACTLSDNTEINVGGCHY